MSNKSIYLLTDQYNNKRIERRVLLMVLLSDKSVQDESFHYRCYLFLSVWFLNEHKNHAIQMQHQRAETKDKRVNQSKESNVENIHQQ